MEEYFLGGISSRLRDLTNCLMVEFYESFSIFLFVDTLSLSFQEPKDQHLYLFIKTVVNETIFLQERLRDGLFHISLRCRAGGGGGLFIWRLLINKYK